MRKCIRFWHGFPSASNCQDYFLHCILLHTFVYFLCCRLIAPKCMGLIPVGSGSGRCHLLKHTARSWSECQPGAGKAGSWGLVAESRGVAGPGGGGEGAVF